MKKLFSAFVKHISFPIISKRDGLPGLTSHLKRLEESQYWTGDRIREYQFQKVKAILIHAFNHTEFYKRKFKEIGFDPYKFHHLDELKRIPLLDKNQIRDHLKLLIATNFNPNELHSSETGGTTGVKMKFSRDNDCLSPKEAALFRFEKWAGWDFGEKVGIIWPAQQDYVGHWTTRARIKNHFFRRQVVFPAAIMDERSVGRYLNELMIKKPTIIRAFSSPVYEVAKFINQRGMHDLELKGVITTGEPLYAHQRKEIEKAFNCRVYDSYRTREAGPIAQECDRHSGMHINSESLYVETVEKESISNLQETQSEILVTDLLNYGMPLIRYRMGDVGTLSSEQCACGRGLPILRKIVGRTADTMITPEGRKVASGSLVLYLVDEAPGLVGQVQIIQDERDHLIIRMTKNPVPSVDVIQYQKKTVERLFGPNMRVSFESVDKIPAEPSGKYRFTICKIGKG